MYLDIKAFGKQSVRFFRGRAYMPKETKDYMKMVGSYARTYMRDNNLVVTDGPVFVNVIFHLAVPKSYSKAKRAAALAGEIYPRKKPDNCNVIKGIHDAMIGIFYTDDSHIIDQCSRKRYAEKDSIHISISYAPIHPLYKLQSPVYRDMRCHCGHCLF